MFDSKFNQWMFALAMGFIAIACYWGKKSNSPEALKVEQDFTYEMPRQKSFSADFDLSGRSIVRKTETIKNTTVTKGPLPSPAVPTATQNTASAKNAAQAAAKKAEEQKKKVADAKKAEEARRSRATVNIAKGVDGQDKPMARLADSSNSAGGNGYGGSAYSPAVAQQDPTQAAANDPNNNIPKYTASQWQTLLMSSPNATNGAQFLAAYRKNLVDATGFYQVVSALISDPAKDRETLGVSLLQQTPSLKSFTILVDSSAQIQDPTLKTKATQMVTNYAAPSQFSVLAQALYSTDAHVVSAATELINEALATESSQGQGGGSSTGGAAANPQQFQIFVPGLTKLASSSDPTIAAQAQALLSSIQAIRV